MLKIKNLVMFEGQIELLYYYDNFTKSFHENYYIMVTDEVNSKITLQMKN